MRQLSYFLMVGLAFIALQTTTVEAQAPSAPPMGEPMCFDPARGEIPCSEMPGADPNMVPPVSAPPTMAPGTMPPPVDISHCADMPPTTRPACEAQAHANSAPTPVTPPMTPPPGMAPPLDCPPGTTNPLCGPGMAPPLDCPPGSANPLCGPGHQPPGDVSDGLPPADPCMAVPAGPDRVACYSSMSGSSTPPMMAPPAP